MPARECRPRIFFVRKSCFLLLLLLLLLLFLGVCVCVHMHHVNFFKIVFKGKSLSWVHVCLCAQACVPRIFFSRKVFFGGCMCIHARMTCTYCMD